MNDAPDEALDKLLDSWRDWGLSLTRRPERLERIRSGRTNRNYRLSAPGRSEQLLLRVNHPDPGRLGIDRARERKILSWTADAGIARAYWYWDPDQRFVVFPWLPGRTWTATDLKDPGQLARLWPMIERTHALSPDGPRRRYHAYLQHYWQQLKRSGGADRELTDAWLDFEPRLEAFDQAAWPARLVHHDLIPDNIIDTGERLYLIDWEYAAPGHPDIDVWTVDPKSVREPFVAEMMGWINGLWERLMRASGHA